MVDDEISDSVFGTESGKRKKSGRKFYWEGPIEVELPNRVRIIIHKLHIINMIKTVNEC